MHKYLLLSGLFFISHLISAQCISGDCKNGIGTYKYPSGARYTGHFQNGEIHGIGVCYYTDGSKYQGEWVNRYPEGKGTKTYADGTGHTGLWRKGKPVDAEGNIQEQYIAKKKEENTDDGTNIQSGCLAGDCKNGPGTYAYPDGSKYDGNFANGKFEGTGIFSFANGDVYSGGFKENYPDGQGTRKMQSGEIETGEWRQGEFLGNSLIVGGRVGCIEGDCDNGQGTYVYKEGSAKYTGFFKDKNPHGFGTCSYANGDVYEGEWQEGAFGGRGTLRLRDKTKVTGYWRAGEYTGQSRPDDYVAAPSPVVETPVVLSPEAKVWAVVVGVASYDHMPVLRYTDDDAYRFYAFLKSLEGGALPDDQIRILIDEEATRENVLGTLTEIFNMAGPEDLVVFYFSGHGLNGSFLPIDFDGFNNKIGHNEIAAIFNKTRAKFKLCLADACHSGSLIAMRSGETEPLLTQYYKTLSNSVSGTAIIMSSKAEETSLESSGLRQGVFSHFLIRGLKGEADTNNDKIVTIGELFDYINANVRSYTGNRQSPVIKGTYDPKMTVAVMR